MKQWIRLTGRMGLHILIAALVGTLLLTVAYLLPMEPIQAHVERSALVMEAEDYFPILYPWCSSQLDNYTDCTMLLEAGYVGEGNALQRAMKVERPTKTDTNIGDVYVGYYLHGLEPDGTATYSRYWHGYMIYLKPLLLFMSYKWIRRLGTALQIAVDLWLVWLLYKRKLAGYILPYLIGLGLMMPVVLAKNMQFYSCFFIFSLGSIALLLMRDLPQRQCLFIFLYLGIATAFFDFLTYPVTTFGVPAVIWLALQPELPLKNTLCKMGQLFFGWGFGYAGMWACKWVIATLVTDENVIVDALENVAIRASHEDNFWGGTYSVWQTVKDNLKAFMFTPVMYIALAFLAVAAIWLLVVWYRSRTRLTTLLAVVVPFALLCCLPLVWYCLVVNHSAFHARFTNKACVVTAFSGMALFVRLRQECQKGLSPRP